MLLDDEKKLHYYLDESEKTRNLYGITRIKDSIWICDLETLEKLPEPEKTYLRNWIKEQKAKGLYKGVIKHE